MTPDLIIFDCDGVLIDSEVLASRVVAEALGDLGFRYSAHDMETRFAGFTDKAIAEAVSAETGKAVPEDFPERVARRAIAVFETELQSISGIEAVLEGLALPKCVASNSQPDRLEYSLKVVGLRHHFPARGVFSAAFVKEAKPAPDLHLHAAQAFGAAPERSIVIEDSVTGVQAARAAGMTAIGFLGASHVKPGQDAKLRAAGAKDVVPGAAALSSYFQAL